VEIPGEAPFIGFVGLMATGDDMPFAPAIEVGWRLARRYWATHVLYRIDAQARP
jgi:hypothetical protein